MEVMNPGHRSSLVQRRGGGREGGREGGSKKERREEREGGRGRGKEEGRREGGREEKNQKNTELLAKQITTREIQSPRSHKRCDQGALIGSHRNYFGQIDHLVKSADNHLHVLITNGLPCRHHNREQELHELS